MGEVLFIQLLAHVSKQRIEARGVDYRPRDDLYTPTMKSRYEVLVLLFFDDLLELEREPRYMREN
jgi:hypothetical protein